MPDTRSGELAGPIGTGLSKEHAEVADAQDMTYADAQDMTYADALFDAELRSYMQTEYGSVSPPSGVFRKVMLRIDMYKAEQARSSMSVFGTLRSFYRALSTPSFSRIVPAGIALMVILGILGADASHLLTGSGTVVRQPSPAASSPKNAPASPAINPMESSRNLTDPGATPAIAASGYQRDAFRYDPVNGKIAPQYIASRKGAGGEAGLQEIPANFVTKSGPQ